MDKILIFNSIAVLTGNHKVICFIAKMYNSLLHIDWLTVSFCPWVQISVQFYFSIFTDLLLVKRWWIESKWVLVHFKICVRVTQKFLHKNGLSTKFKIWTIQASWRSTKYFPRLRTKSVHRSGSCSNPPLQNFSIRDTIRSARAFSRSFRVFNFRPRQNISGFPKAWKSHGKMSGE